MQKHELSELSQRLAQLADALGGRAPSPAGLLVWGDALAECGCDDVMAVLSDWPKAHAKMRLCRERLSARVEGAAAQRAKSNREPWSATSLPASTEMARQHMAEIRRILRRPKPDRKAWIPRVLAAGASESYAYALALKAAGGLQERHETESEREARLEREAIQADAGVVA
jgi:hypothetical protein